LPIGSSKLVTNHLIMGVGTGGGTNQGVDAVYNDISLTYNSKVTVEQEGLNLFIVFFAVINFLSFKAKPQKFAKNSFYSSSFLK